MIKDFINKGVILSASTLVLFERSSIQDGTFIKVEYSPLGNGLKAEIIHVDDLKIMSPALTELVKTPQF